ncbi:hypothetical protein AB1Y20_020078 [Prymnesium parvum]|uniref:Calcyclin-binding protein n=1 Tax=Prymnesium parvum TaxID=97485 RepID=A0AB34JWX8_PRYPA
MAKPAAALPDELQEDLTEIENLHRLATRPHVRALLSTYADNLREERKRLLATKASSPTASPSNQQSGHDVWGNDAATPPQPSPVKLDASPTPSSTASTTASPPQPKPLAVGASVPAAGGTAVQYVPISSHSWDQDSYGTEPNNVYVHILSGFDGIGQQKDRVTCQFTQNSFDLKVHDFNGKSYRLVKTNLDKNIIAEDSKVIVKKNSIKICLRKEKGKYGYDTWTDLTAKRRKIDTESDPGAGIMDMMKQMYDEGDDQMKKTIGEAMLKSRQKDHRKFDDE